MIGTERQKGQIALYTLALVLATLAVACRLWARRITRTRWQANDTLIILAYVNVIALGICANLAVVLGEMGAHRHEIPPENLVKVTRVTLKMTIYVPLTFICSSFFTKMSITHFYVTIFKHSSIYRACRIQFVLLILTWISSVTRCMLLCRPLNYVWDKSIEGGKCSDFRDFLMETSALALVFDVSCVLLPIPVVWRLNLSTAKKMRLTVLFSIGILICIITALRLYYSEQLSYEDLSWTGAPAVMFAVPEPALGIVVGCLPLSLPVFRKASKAVKKIMFGQPHPKRAGPDMRKAHKVDLMAPERCMTPYPLVEVSVESGRSGGNAETSPQHPSIWLRSAGTDTGQEFTNTGGITVLTEVHIKSERSWFAGADEESK